MNQRFSRDGRAARPSDAESGEYVKNEIDIMLDRINHLWMKLEKKLLKKEDARRITCNFDTSEAEGQDPQLGYWQSVERSYLGIQRHAGKWRVCYARTWNKSGEDDLPWKPVVECDMDSRMKAAEGIDDLKREVANTRTIFKPKLNETIDKLQRALDEDEDEHEV